MTTVIVYWIISPAPNSLSPSSITLAILVTSMDFVIVVCTTVASSAAAVEGSSEESFTLFVCPGLSPWTNKVFLTSPVFAASGVITKVALYLSVSATLRTPCAVDVSVDETNVGPVDKVRTPPREFVKFSVKSRLLMVTFPWFSIKIS